MQDIGIYADRFELDFEMLLECVTSCDEKVFAHARVKPGRRDVEQAGVSGKGHE